MIRKQEQDFEKVVKKEIEKHVGEKNNPLNGLKMSEIYEQSKRTENNL